MRRGQFSTLLFLLVLPLAAFADALVLVPGYLSGGHTWRAHGITHGLAASGWQDGGNLTPGPDGPHLDITPQAGGNRFYTVELPSEAPLPVQASYLNAYLDAIRAIHADEPMILAGHSAGGVLARYVMVSRPELKVDALVTIASPHSGSDAAEMGELIADSPMAWFAPMMGMDTINRSRDLYRDLGRPDGWNLLGWLNTHPHPQAHYVSIVHPNDEWVDAPSQDMNRVPALAGRSQVLASAGGHELNPADGILLSRLLADLDR